jgi:hypothetical protein
LITLEEFTEYYKEHGMCKGDAFRRKNKYTQKQLKTRYEKYCKKYNEEDMTKDQELRERVIARDGTCRLFKVLNWQEKIDMSMYNVSTDDGDVAHVFPKSSYPWMRYDLNNVVLLSRTFHNRLDEQKHPITGKPISKLEARNWWIRIVGNTTYAYLEDKAKNGRQV